jgi:hypothetical protein
MRQILLFLLILISFSCQEKKDNTDNGKDFDHSYIQEIGRLYNAERIDTRPTKIGPREERKDYTIDVTNSDSLEKNLINLKLGAENIAYLYKKHLKVNRRNPKKIIVNIKLKNRTNQSFKFDEKKLTRLVLKK